jgi:hypothetical protein
MTIAPIAAIKTGLSVKEIASRGTAAIITPSARLETMLEAQIRLNAGPITPTLLPLMRREKFYQLRQISDWLI